ncbi:hypothetical protein OrNV_gp043 [Oryctes rhinoceros nudivirus]|uniref:Uncharacterized protein n=1 Tax=Oryctes rhinoceros nudivirus TaxID=92521 RepID=A3QTZ1_9VIRU|nr:hypothetical protein OrNV_gp043 [Oryctes rhinoceros nudivirus]ABF93328.1 unknown [Oryctes rhinoceros nudivirus]ACH96173.1 unknown [Oryctes rhinoceros nudivirus]QHG11281.1 hypothetical protein SI_OrNV_gp043 [Oryctes rhinoceros nudivirus]QKE59516.1 hypothetical protein SI_OrNV_gp043 [Oryctes rhinoceros nudivirus]UBO76463.1 hypothetical protein SI_OrNV_gp043 [Oryctes rhinoceros nudivirus]
MREYGFVKIRIVHNGMVCVCESARVCVQYTNSSTLSTILFYIQAIFTIHLT